MHAAEGIGGEVLVDISMELALRVHAMSGGVGMAVSVGGGDADDFGMVAGTAVAVDGHDVVGIVVAAAGDDAQALVSEEYAILEDTAS